MDMLKISNNALAFLLELSALVSLASWGFTFPATRIIQVIIGILAPLTLAILWSVFCAPLSPHRFTGLSLIIVKCIFFGLVACCLFSMKLTMPAIILCVFVVINLGLSYYLGTL